MPEAGRQFGTRAVRSYPVFASGLNDFVSLAGDMSGQKGISDFGRQNAQFWNEQADKIPVDQKYQGWKGLTDPKTFLPTVAGSVGDQATNIITALGTGAATAATAAKLALPKIVQRGAAIAGTALPNIAQEGSYQDKITAFEQVYGRKPTDKELKKIQKTALSEKTINSILETASDYLLFNRLFPTNKGINKGIKKIGKNALEQAINEGATEAAQEGVSIGAEKLLGINQGDNLSRLLDSASIGAVTGGVMGGAGTAISQPFENQFPENNKVMTRKLEKLAPNAVEKAKQKKQLDAFDKLRALSKEGTLIRNLEQIAPNIAKKEGISTKPAETLQAEQATPVEAPKQTKQAEKAPVKEFKTPKDIAQDYKTEMINAGGHQGAVDGMSQMLEVWGENYGTNPDGTLTQEYKDWYKKFMATQLPANSNNVHFQSAAMYNKNSYLQNNGKKAIDNFYNKHAQHIEKEPEKYTGSRKIKDVLKFLGSKDGKKAVIKTPVGDVTITRGNVTHLVNDNETERLGNLNKVVSTLKNPNIVINADREGNNYNYYVKAFKGETRNKAHLQVIKLKDDGNFYTTNYHLKNNQFENILKNGQIIYDLSDLTAPTENNSVPVNNIITDNDEKNNPNVKNGNTYFQSAQTAGAENNRTAIAKKEWEEKGTESRFFKKWFGDSKVVDENGKPLVVYHTGTFNDVYDLNQSRSYNGDVDYELPGIYATPILEDSAAYGTPDQTKALYMSIKNPYQGNLNELRNEHGSWREVMDYLKEQGYDGVIEKENDEYVAFSPEQIKSVDNQGTFDNSNPNIYFQEVNEGENDNVAVTPVNIDKDSVPNFNTINELKNWIYENLALLGTVNIKSNNRDVQFSKKAIDRSLKGIYRYPVKRNSYAGLKELVENSIFGGEIKADEKHKDKVKGQELYYNALTYNGETYGVKISVDIPKQKNTPYTYAGHKIEIMKAPAASEVGSNELTFVRPEATIIIHDIKKLFNPNVNNSEDNTYYQSANENYKGYFLKTEDKNVIGLMKNSDPSTVVHETGHLFLDGLNELAKTNEAAKEQLAAVNEWLGAKNGEYTTNQHEKFARSFEAYLDTGKAPNSKLKEVFENFKKWLQKVYGDIKNIPNAEISDEVRNMFDNMFKEKTPKTPGNRSVNESVEKVNNAYNLKPNTVLAIKNIIKGSEEETVKNMRDDLEQFGGTNDVSIIFGDSKKGLQHIADNHGKETVLKVIQAAESGEISKFVPGKKTVHIEKGDIEAVLSLDEHGNKKSWILTGWNKRKSSGEERQVSTNLKSTQIEPTFSRQDLGAELNNIITDNGGKFNPDVNKSKAEESPTYYQGAETADLKESKTPYNKTGEKASTTPNAGIKSDNIKRSMQDNVKQVKTYIRRWNGGIQMDRYDVNKRLNEFTKAVDTIAKQNKLNSKNVREIMPFLRERTEFPESLNRDDLKKVWQYVKQRPELEAKLTHLADTVSNSMQKYYDRYKEVKARDKSIDNENPEIKNYITHDWKVKNKKQESLVTNYFTTTSRFAKQRKIPTLYEGIEGVKIDGETVKFTPNTLDYAELVKMSSDSMIKATHDTVLADRVKNLRTPDGVRLVLNAPVQKLVYPLIKDRLMTVLNP